MDSEKKLQFIAHMTNQALNHVASTPNIMSPNGEMPHDKRMAFVQAMAKHGLKHFDTGGYIGGQIANSDSNVLNAAGSGLGGTVNTLGSGVKSVANTFTNQNGFNATLAPTQSSNYSGIIGSASGNSLNGYGQSQDIQAQQQGLANQLQLQSEGKGPNPAQAELAQETGKNVANQASLIAGVRGSASNPGLAARQASQQGSSIQQNAVGQAATLQAQQQLAAEAALANQQNNIASGNIAEQGVNNNLFNSAAGAQNVQNKNDIENYNNAQTLNAATSQNNSNAVNQTTAGLLSGLGGAAGALFAKGGEVSNHRNIPDHFKEVAAIYHPHYYAGGGYIPSNGRNVTGYADKGSSGGPSSLLDKISGGGADSSGAAGGTEMAGADEAAASGALLAAMGGKVKAQNSSEKAVKKDNSIKNDKVPALLSEGEIVIPREITMHPMAPEKAAAFVAKTLAKRKMIKK